MLKNVCLQVKYFYYYVKYDIGDIIWILIIFYLIDLFLFIDYYLDVFFFVFKGNIIVYVGDDFDKIVVVYEYLVYENRYDKCQFVKNINEFKVDRWIKVYFIQDVFCYVIYLLDIDKMWGVLDEIYLVVG